MIARPSTEAHLAAYTAHLPDGLALPVVAQTSRGFRIIAAATRGDLAPAIAAVVEHRWANTYLATCAMRAEDLHELARSGRRGGKAHAAALVAVFADIDIAGPAHKGDKPLPENVDQALAVIDQLPPPSMLVHTGHGLHAHWLLNEPLPIDDGNRAEAGRLVDGWVRTVARRAAELGCEIDDSVGELARVLRLAGTFNVKLAHRPRAVQILDVGDWPAGGLLEHGWAWRPGVVYTADELVEHLNPLPKVTRRQAPSVPQPVSTPKGTQLDILDAVSVAPWRELWPTDWTFVGETTVDGVVVERWRRPGATSPHSATCWPDGGCYVFSDAVTGLPAGSYSKSDVLAWRLNTDLSGLARALIEAGRARLKEAAR